MAVTVYQVGQLVRMQGSFYNENDVLTDPTTITMTITKPDGSTVSKTKADLTNVSTGVYTYDYQVDMDGAWRYKFESTGPISAYEDYFPVRPVQVPAKYR